jgi:hypothetical protein
LTEKIFERFHFDWNIGNRFIFITLDFIIHIKSTASFVYIINVRIYKCSNDDNETNFFFLKGFFVAAGWNVLLEWLWTCSTVSYSFHPHQTLSLVRILQGILSTLVSDKILLKLIFKKFIFIAFSANKEKSTLIQWAITSGNLL